MSPQPMDDPPELDPADPFAAREERPRRRRKGGASADLNLPRRYTRWAVWGCFSLSLAGLLIIGGILLATMQQAGFRAWIRFAEDVNACGAHLHQITGALQRHEMDRGSLPARLEDLSPTYLADAKFLLCPAAQKHGGAKAGGTDYVYRNIVSGQPQRDILVYCPHHPTPRRNGDTVDDNTIYQIPLIRGTFDVDSVTGRLSAVEGGAAQKGRP